MGTDYVVVHATHDQIEAEMMLDLLRDQEVDARLLGDANATRFGAATFAFELRVEAAAGDAARAAELVEAFFVQEHSRAGLSDGEAQGCVEEPTEAQPVDTSGGQAADERAPVHEPAPEEATDCGDADPDADDQPPREEHGDFSRDPVWAPLFGLTALHATLFFAGAGDPVRLRELGGLSGWPSWADGYRFLTANFLHVDLNHLLSNTHGLLLYGWAAIRMFGLGRAAAVYVSAGLVSAVATALAFDAPTTAVGSSGCVFALIALTIAAKARLARRSRVARWRGVVRVSGWVLFALPPAFYFNYVGHFAGVAVGALAGSLLAFADSDDQKSFLRRDRLGLAFAAALVVMGWGWRFVAPAYDPCGTGSVARCEAACERGEAASCLAVGVRESQSEGGSPKKAESFFERGCEGGVAEACRELGLLRTDRYADDDSAYDMWPYLQPGIELLERGCDGGSIPACLDAAARLPDEERFDARAADLYRKACDGGGGSGCFQLAEAHAKGSGVARDLPAAAKLYEAACSDRVAEACRALSALMSEGRGVERNPRLAAHFLREACALGDDASCPLDSRPGATLAPYRPIPIPPPRSPGGSAWINPLSYL